MNAALGGIAGVCHVNRGPDFNVGAHSGEWSGHIPVVSLDALRLPVVDAILLDVERSETQVLRGAIETIKRCRPVVCIEDDVEESRELLLGLGYREVERVGANPDIVFKRVGASQAEPQSKTLLDHRRAFAFDAGIRCLRDLR
jgi:hypothetical protein